MKNKLTVSNLKKLGMEKISIKNLISNNQLDILSLFKMGRHNYQSIYTILATKLYDIDRGYCYWALKNPNNAEKVKNFIMTGEFKENKVKKDDFRLAPYYVLITFTDSMNSTGDKDTKLDIGKEETTQTFFDRLKDNYKSYIEEINDDIKLKRKQKVNSKLKIIGEVKYSDIDNPYPSDRFPEIINIEGNKSMAYVFDKLYYSTEKINDISEIFEQVKMNDEKGKFDMKSNQSNFFLKLQNKKIENIIDTENVQYIVARVHPKYTTRLYY